MQLSDARPLRQGRLQVVRRLGRGGSGAVFEVLDRETQGRLAVKQLRFGDADSLQFFKDEFREFHDIVHPNLVHLGELFEENGEWFFTMELVEGVDLLEYVRPAAIAPAPQNGSGNGATSDVKQREESDKGKPPFHETRLRASLSQLVVTIDFLHKTGKLHRDIKPSNILVTADGRVVVLDFGFALGFGQDEASPPQTPAMVGTIHYMSPEQASGGKLGPASDWYAFGATLYEALTGRVPFTGDIFSILIRKQKEIPIAPSQLFPEIPGDLDKLCVDLLHPDAVSRPDGAQILARLAATPHKPVPGISQTFSQSGAPVFVGRDEEFAKLTAAFDATKLKLAGRAVIVTGESGIGKSALVQSLVHRLHEVDPDAVIFSGRCYERETVPYKAVDGVIDSMSRYLARISSDEVERILPVRARLLAEAFPVLYRVDAFKRVQQPERSRSLDPQEQRTRLFTALRELFIRLADRQSVIVVIDDLQWADADSLAMLNEVLRPPEEPPLLFLGTSRDSPYAQKNPLHPASPLWSFPQLDCINLERLSEADAENMAALLLQAGQQQGQEASETLQVIVREAQGHPLFVQELVRHVLAGGQRTTSTMRLDDVLKTRMAELLPIPRRILEMVVVAGAPIAQTVIAKAAAVDPSELARDISLLKVGRLVQTTVVQGQRMICAYHNRVSDALAQELDDQTLQRHNHALAEAIEASDTKDSRVLARHWSGAGARDKAAKYTLQAAVEAEAVFAFERAAKLYREASRLLPAGDSTLKGVYLKLGEALANEGRGAESALAFQSAMDQATPAEALLLQLRVAEQLLGCGHIDAGTKAFNEVLASFGMRPAKSQLSALFWSVVRKLWLRIFGFGFPSRSIETIDTRKILLLDTLWTATRCYMFINAPRGMDYQTRFALRALRVGEPGRVAMALCSEASTTAASAGTARGYARALERLKQAEALSATLQDPFSAAHFKSHASFVHYYGGNFAEARKLAEEAETIYTEHCTGVTWYIVGLRRYLSMTLYYLGDLLEMYRRVSAFNADAERRGDVWGLAAFGLGVASLSALQRDDPENARRRVFSTMQRLPSTGFSSQDLHALIALAQLDLYEGNTRDAWQRLKTCMQPLSKSHLLHVRYFRIEIHHLIGRVALARAQEQPAQSPSRHRLLDLAERCVAVLEQEPFDWAHGLACLLRAGTASLQWNRQGAFHHTEMAIKLFDRNSMALYAAAARWRGGVLQGGKGGAALIESARSFMDAQQVRRPKPLVNMLAPGLGEEWSAE